MGEIGILRLCGWAVLILEWVVRLMPVVLMAILVAIVVWLVCASICAMRARWYRAIGKIAEGIRDEDTEE